MPDTNRLTRIVYDKLAQSHHEREALVFGYVVAKLVARRAKEGGSPFEPVNIEAAYDALIKLVDRDNDILSDFVAGWDPVLELLRPEFSKRAFVEYIKSAIGVESRPSLSGGRTFRASVDSGRLEQAAEEIAKAIGPAFQRKNDRSSLLNPFFRYLVESLSAGGDKTDYLGQLVDFAAPRSALLATLNYDTLVEDQARARGVEIDYGLSAWNVRKQVTFGSSGLPLMKLHGSLNWYGGYDSIHVDKPLTPHQSDRVIIFGTHNDKLNPEGPFLQLRHHFEAKLLRTDALLVIGYSFGDRHLNSLIRRWIGTRDKAKLVVVDPGQPALTHDLVGSPYIPTPDGRIKRWTVEIQHIARPAAAAMGEALESLSRKPELSLEQTR